MLLGEYQHNIDAKGRVIVPAKFREELGESFYVTKGLGGCLWAFPPKEWEAILQKFADMPIVERRHFFRREPPRGNLEYANLEQGQRGI